MKFERVNYGLVLLLSFIACILIVIFTIPKASALVVEKPNETKTINNTTYYGYYIPTRVRATENKNYVQLGIYYRNHSYLDYNHHLSKNVSYNFYTSDEIGYQPVRDYLNNHNVELPLDFNYNFTPAIPLKNDSLFNELLGPRRVRFSFSFHPGINQSSQNIGSMFDTGYAFNYDYYYSFKFNVILYQPNGGLGANNQTDMNSGLADNYNGALYGNLGNNQSSVAYCALRTNDPQGHAFYCSSATQGNTYNTRVLYQDSKIQVIEFEVLFNNNGQFKFSDKGLAFYGDLHGNVNEEDTGFVTEDFSGNWFDNRISTFSSYGLDADSTIIMFSEVYQITAWTTNSDVLCQGDSCWTEQETTENSENISNIYNSYTFIESFMNSINGFLSRDYGFSGIVHSTYNFILSLLDSVQDDDTCYIFSVNILGADIRLPCGYDFWNREDMATFVVVYNSVFTGVLAYLLCWKIYKDIINVMNPNGKLIDRNEVDSL